ncbi:MAG: metal ABC transporter solute-binding protein, Zn/Mn family [Thomasclavelia ramosa]
MHGLQTVIMQIKKNIDYFPVSTGVEVIYLEGNNTEGKEDPHAWLNLENGIIYAKILNNSYLKRPVNKDFYKHNLDKYVKNYLILISKQNKFSLIPENER